MLDGSMHEEYMEEKEASKYIDVRALTNKTKPGSPKNSNYKDLGDE
jgi:hypothetical protein